MKEDTHTEKVTSKNDYFSCKLILVFFLTGVHRRQPRDGGVPRGARGRR